MVTRIRGAALLLDIGGARYDCEVTSCRIDVAVDKDRSSICETVYSYQLVFSAIQSTDTDSLWSYIWGHAGEYVPFVYAPHGNLAPTVEQPHFAGLVVIGAPPSIGGQAGRSNTYTFGADWDVFGALVVDRGA